MFSGNSLRQLNARAVLHEFETALRYGAAEKAQQIQDANLSLVPLTDFEAVRRAVQGA